MTESIIVGTDGSAAADQAVQWAADDAHLRGLPLRIVYAIDRVVYAIPVIGPYGLPDDSADIGQQILTAARRSVLGRHPEIRVTTSLVTDSPARALCEETGDGDQLVLGHRGRGGFASMLLGSTGLRVAGHARVPVVIVRGRTESDSDREVVVGLDLTHPSETTLRYAFEAAAARNAAVRVVHAWRAPASVAAGGHTFEIKEIEESIRWNLITAHAPWRERYPGIEVTERIVQDHPVAALADLSRRADLVVVGAHHCQVPWFGAVGHGVVHHAHCPVAIIPAG